MRRLRNFGAIWPLLFIAPLWIVLDRLCWSAPTHFLLHATMALHERLPAIIAAAAAVSLAVIAWKLGRVNANLRTLRALAGPLPNALHAAVASQAASLDMREPPVIYLDVATPICYTIVPGPSILLSRGFVEQLAQGDLDHVVRHELVHVRRRDPQRGLLWHLLFSALLVPGFGDLERWLYDRRERHTNELAGTLDRDRYASLSLRVREAESVFECSLGRSYAGALAPRRKECKPLVFLRPALATALFAALLVSHAVFMNALPFLERHHC